MGAIEPGSYKKASRRIIFSLNNNFSLIIMQVHELSRQFPVSASLVRSSYPFFLSVAFPESSILFVTMIEIICNDRLGKKVRVKCNPEDKVGDLKRLIAAQTGTRPEKIVLKKWYTIYKDNVTLEDYEIHDGMCLELYYQ